jgi:HlyD family secretion protein
MDTSPAFFLLVALLFAPGCRREQGTRLDGRIEAYQSDLGARVPGRLAELLVFEGQRVKQGDLLARISAEELDAAVQRDKAGFDSAQARQLLVEHGNRAEDIAQGEARVRDAEAALLLAEDTLKRVTRLQGERIVAQADLDSARAVRDRAAAGLDLQRKALAVLKAGARSEERMSTFAQTRQAEAVFQQTRSQAGFMEVRAPFDGVVLHRLREPGTVLSAGQPVLTLARLDRLWVKCYLPQVLQVKVGLGQKVRVETLDGRVIEAKLDEISADPEYTPKVVETAEERVNLVYPARVNLQQAWDRALMPGQAVIVQVDK